MMASSFSSRSESEPYGWNRWWVTQSKAKSCRPGREWQVNQSMVPLPFSYGLTLWSSAGRHTNLAQGVNYRAGRQAVGVKEGLTKISMLPPTDLEHLSRNLEDRSRMPSSAADRMMLVLAYRSARTRFLLACWYGKGGGGLDKTQTRLMATRDRTTHVGFVEGAEHGPTRRRR